MAPNAECPLAEKDRRAVLAVLDHQRLRPHGKHLARGARQAGLISQHLGFTIIDQQNVHNFQSFPKL